ncbi:unnamed protein product [Orchesella dallaii]|uniref:Exportin-2 n=1 Tax=Orchesella dallaii TaxID=48710 RepID=A0ABP1PK13_9HEXA
MEINEVNLQALGSYLQQTLSPDPNIRKPAEKYLESVEVNKNYPLLLLSLVDNVSVDVTIRVAGSIVFKNYVKRNWKIIDDVNKIDTADRQAIKSSIVNLMLKSPENIQRQLSDAVSVIGREDFPKLWPDLLKELIEKFNCDDFHIINGVLQTAHSLFKRYRFELKSEDLWREIKFVLDNFAAPLTALFLKLMELASQHATNKDAIKVIYSSLLMIAKIFNSLNAQDIPEYFEDNMAVWMSNFHTLLITDNPLLKTGVDEDAGLLEQIRSQICDNIGMYAQKYDEEFQEMLPQFVTAVWNLLTSTGNQSKYDLLVSNAIQFLALVAEKQQHKQLFADPSTLSSICQKVIIPNMEFRESDEELFEDNPEEYIRRDIEGSDVDTRRRAACDLVKALSRYFEPQITEVFGQYITAMLTQYNQNPNGGWKSKDAAIYLVTSLAAKGQTQRHGITQTNQLVNIVDFYTTYILPDLQAPNVNELPVLKADAIKYLMIFRNQLPQYTVKEGFPNLIRFLRADSAVVHTYAANCIDKILILKNTDNTALIKSADISGLAQELIASLFAALEKPSSKENEYVMKAIMRSLSTLQEAVIPIMPHVLPKLVEILMMVTRNPSKPHFNHYLFESLSLCIRIMCSKNPQFVAQFEASLFPIIQVVLQQDVIEFIPYMFQILSLLLDFHTNSIPDPYMTLFPCLLVPVLWERPANIHPLVQLLQAYISKGPQQVAASDKINALLGVFQKLIASKSNDHEGFYLVQSLVENMPPEVMQQFLKPIFLLLFQRITSSKTTKFVKCLLVYFSVFINRYGASAFVSLIDGIENKFMTKVLDRLFIAEVQKVSGTIERKICAVGITKLLCDVPEVMLNGEYTIYWEPLLTALIKLFELPEDDSVPENEHFVEIEDTPGYQTAYSRLNFANKPEMDPLKDTVPNAKIYLAQSLSKLSVAVPGRLIPLTASMNPDAQNFLTKYLREANVQLF